MIELKKFLYGLFGAIKLNFFIIFYKLIMKKKIILFRIDSFAQITHIETIFKLFKKDKNVKLFIMIAPVFLNEVKRKFCKNTFNSYATNLALFYDIFIGTSPVMRTPMFGKKRICVFYGQPSKGIEYRTMNKKGFDILFFYGQYMYDFYLEEQKRDPKLKEQKYQIYITGQPKTDSFFQLAKVKDKSFFIKKFKLNSKKQTILFAPSYEYCSCLETDGDSIIKTLVDTGLNIIIKPHPIIFSPNINHHNNWYQKLLDIEKKYDNFIFYKDKNIDDALLACDIFFTDYSSVSFDAVAIDKKLIYWYSPKFYDKYLPSKYEIDGKLAKKKLWGNVGRGLIGYDVKNIRDLKNAINNYLDGKDSYLERRAEIDKYLFANKGHAAQVMVNKIYELLDE